MRHGVIRGGPARPAKHLLSDCHANVFILQLHDAFLGKPLYRQINERRPAWLMDRMTEKSLYGHFLRY